MSEHARKSILAKLGAYTERHFHLVKPTLDGLVETGLSDPKVLRRQAAALLDAFEETHVALEAHADRIAKLQAERESDGGRPPSIALDTILDMMDGWGISPDRHLG